MTKAEKELENFMKINSMELRLQFYQTAKLGNYSTKMVLVLVIRPLKTLMEIFSIVKCTIIAGMVTELI